VRTSSSAKTLLLVILVEFVWPAAKRRSGGAARQLRIGVVPPLQGHAGNYTW
jgi:hypothetical protein